MFINDGRVLVWVECNELNYGILILLIPITVTCSDIKYPTKIRGM